MRSGSMREHVVFKKPDESKRDGSFQIDPRNPDHYTEVFERFAAVKTGPGKEMDRDLVESEMSHTVEVWGDPEVVGVGIDWIIVWNSNAGQRVLNIVGPAQRIRVNPEQYGFACLELVN